MHMYTSHEFVEIIEHAYTRVDNGTEAENGQVFFSIVSMGPSGEKFGIKLFRKLRQSKFIVIELVV